MVQLMSIVVPACTLLGCLIVAFVAYRVLSGRSLTHWFGYILILAILLLAFPVAANLDVRWHDRTADGLEARFREIAASQQARMNSELHDITKKPAKPPKPDYEKNKEVQILIFYRRPEDVAAANKVKDALLDQGYQTSASYSDFAGWRTKVPARQIRIVAPGEQLDTSKLKSTVASAFADRKDNIVNETGGLIAGNIHVRIY